MVEITLQYVQFFILYSPYCMICREWPMNQSFDVALTFKEHWPKVIFQAH